MYAKLGVLLTDDDLAGESRYEALMPEVIDRLDQAGLLEESDGAQVVFPPGFTNREGEPLPLIVRSRAGAFTYATSDLACVARPGRAGRARPACCTSSDAGQAQHFAMVFAVAAMAGWLVPPARAEHVAFGLVLGTDRKRLQAAAAASRSGSSTSSTRRSSAAGRRSPRRTPTCRPSSGSGWATTSGSVR